MKMIFKPEYDEFISACFSDVLIMRDSDQTIAFVCNQQTDGISFATVAREFFAEIDIPIFREEIERYFNGTAEFSETEFDIVVDGRAISNSERDRFLIHLVDVCGFRLSETGPVRDF